MLEKMLLQSAKKYSDKTAIVYEERRISYQDLYDQVNSLSQGLNSLGVSQGDCVTILLPNCPEFVISFYAITKLNAIVLPLNHLFKQEEIKYYINDSQTQVIITDQKRAEICRQILSKLERKIELVTIDESVASATYFYDFIEANERKIQDIKSSFEGEAIYQYSSGSTGRPKRVCRTQENLYHEAQNFTATANVNSSDNILCLVPLYHAHGLGNCLLAAISNGATLVILEQSLQNGIPVEVPFVFKLLRVLELITTEKITILPAVPYIFKTLADAPAQVEADVSSLRLVFSAGNFLSKETFERFLQRFNLPIRQLYGCTEAGSIAINLDAEPTKTYNSVGMPMANVEIKILDAQDNELPINVTGEVVIKSKTLTRGYHNLPELNQQAFKDNMFFTGDLGKKDSCGRLYITGRKKILIDTGGRKVDPIEIEDVLIANPKIKEAVVVGVKGSFAGEIIKAVLVTEQQSNCAENEISAYCKERLAEFKIPKIIEFRNEIPKSPLGKILRKELV